MIEVLKWLSLEKKKSERKGTSKDLDVQAWMLTIVDYQWIDIVTVCML